MKPSFDYRRVVASNLLVVFVLVVAVSGAVWATRGSFRSPPPTAALRVLCAEDWLDQAALDEFTRDRHARVDLYTYHDVAEFLRQMANSDGRVDVFCTSSLLVRSLAHSHWIRPTAYAALRHAPDLAADFLHLPYDPAFELGVPLHWTAFGFLSARGPAEGTVKQVLAKGRVGVWASDLNYMALLTQSGVRFEERLESEDVKRLEDEVHRFANSVGVIPPDLARADAAGWLKRFDYAHVPALARDEEGTFSPGDDGGIVDVGVLAIGERAAQPELARDLIDALIAPAAALRTVARTRLGSVHRAAEDATELRPARKPSALRELPLTKLKFPDVNAEATLKFARMLANVRASRGSATTN